MVGFDVRILTFVIALEVPAALLLAADDEWWQFNSIATIAFAAVVTVAWRSWPNLWLEGTCALSWLFALLVSARWLTLPIVFVPLFAIALAGAPFVMRAEVRRLVRDRRGLTRQCPGCGYDIRASRERCPECGSLLDGDAERRRQVAAALRARRLSSTASGETPDAEALD